MIKFNGSMLHHDDGIDDEEIVNENNAVENGVEDNYDDDK